MSASRLIGVCMLAVLSGACTPGVTGPPAAFPHAAAKRACGPTDGAAVAIYLASSPVQSLEPEAPYVRLYVWQAPEDLAGRSWVLTGDEPAGSAWYHRTVADSEGATSGRVTVTSVASDNTIEGWVDVRFASAGRVVGTFRASWIPRTVLCG